MPMSSSRSSFSSKPSSSYKSSSYKSSSYKSKSSSYKSYKSKPKSETKTKAKTYKATTHKPAPVKEVHHYNNSSSASDWIPFMFMASMMNDSENEPVIIEDGKVVQQSPQPQQDTDINGWGIFSSVLVLALVITLIVFGVRKMRRK